MFDDPVTKQYLAARQKFSALSEITKKGSAGLAGLGELRALGQGVSHDDVLKHVVNLLQNGHITPRVAAMELSQIPKGGPALAEWVQQRHDQVAQSMGQLGQQHEAARQDLASSSINKILNAIANGGQGAP